VSFRYDQVNTAEIAITILKFQLHLESVHGGQERDMLTVRFLVPDMLRGREL